MHDFVDAEYERARDHPEPWMAEGDELEELRRGVHRVIDAQFDEIARANDLGIEKMRAEHSARDQDRLR